MDTRDLEASLKRSEALVLQAQQTLDESKANLVQQQTQVALAKQELDRTSALVVKGYATQELLDQRRQQMAGAVAAENAATDKDLLQQLDSCFFHPPEDLTSTSRSLSHMIRRLGN